MSTINQAIAFKQLTLQVLVITYTSGYPWPSATVKSPGFFKLG
jgi:hypothetical protein